MTAINDHFLSELKFSTDNGLRSIASSNLYRIWQKRAAQELLDHREAFASECQRIDRLGQ